MVKNIYNIVVLILVLIFIFGFLRYYKVDEFKTASEDGVKQNCSELFGATKNYTAAKKYKDACWSCPTGFEKTPLRKDPAKEKYCRSNKYVNAIYHSKPEDLFKKCATKDVWYKNKQCWTCPKGYKPARIKEGGGDKTLCKNDDSYTYQTGIKRGNAGCNGNGWSPVLSNKCYKCPDGFNHNVIRIPLNVNPAKDPKVCKREVSLMDHLLPST